MREPVNFSKEPHQADPNSLLAWWKTSLESNIQLIYRLSSTPRILRELPMDRYPGAKARTTTKNYGAIYPLIERIRADAWETLHYTPLTGTVSLSKGWDGASHLCHHSGTKSSFRVLIQPQTSEDIALLVGCKLQDLPAPLQNWTCSNLPPRAVGDASFAAILHLSSRAIKCLENTCRAPGRLKRRSDHLAWLANHPESANGKEISTTGAILSPHKLPLQSSCNPAT
jgi:hypothetical protein